MAPAPPDFTIRDAVAGDLEAIVDGNDLLAFETEARRLDRAVLRRGVARALDDSGRLRYWVAVDAQGRVVGQTAISCEWSDWRDGWLWWLQSVYVVADFRGRGVFKALYARVVEEARAAGDVIGVRLYVEHDNHRAKRAYEALGLGDAGYSVLEDVWTKPDPAEA